MNTTSIPFTNNAGESKLITGEVRYSDDGDLVIKTASGRRFWIARGAVSVERIKANGGRTFVRVGWVD